MGPQPGRVVGGLEPRVFGVQRAAHSTTHVILSTGGRGAQAPRAFTGLCPAAGAPPMRPRNVETSRPGPNAKFLWLPSGCSSVQLEHRSGIGPQPSWVWMSVVTDISAITPQCSDQLEAVLLLLKCRHIPLSKHPPCGDMYPSLKTTELEQIFSLWTRWSARYSVLNI